MKRASGTFWEDQIATAGIVVPVFTLLFGVSGGGWFAAAGFALLVLPILALMDLWLYTRFDLLSLHYDETLRIGEVPVDPKEVVSMQQLNVTAGRNHLSLVEIYFTTPGSTGYALCQCHTAWLFMRRYETIEIILRHFPELKGKVLFPQYGISVKEVKDPTKRTPSKFISDLDRPVVYRTFHPRDPYFLRRRAR